VWRYAQQKAGPSSFGFGPLLTVFAFGDLPSSLLADRISRRSPQDGAGVRVAAVRPPPSWCSALPPAPGRPGAAWVVAPSVSASGETGGSTESLS
jgi:hypothetical protein